MEKIAYLIRSVEEYGKLISLCIENDVMVFRTYWDEREKGNHCYSIDWVEKRCYHSDKKYYLENDEYKVVIPVFECDTYGNYHITEEKPLEQETINSVSDQPDDKKDLNPSLDGVEHINIYSKGATELGKMLSNFAKFPIETEDGNFMSVEGYWYYLSISENEPRREDLRKAYGYWAKKLGKEILQETNNGESSRFDDDFENKILKAIRFKFERNLHLITPNLKNLPFEHYYNFGGKVVDVKEKYQWMIDGISQMRDELAAWAE